MSPAWRRYMFLPIALVVLFGPVLIYFAAALAASMTHGVAGVFDWVMNTSDRVIDRLEQWGNTL